MGYDKNRDTEEIERFCNDFAQFCENVRTDAGKLAQIASSAEASLRDEVGKGAIERVYDLAAQLLSCVEGGDEAILTLRKQNHDLEERFENLRGRLK